ncbi:MAG TPA: hypothetical protein VGE83_11585 [Terracidiphilus sp.]
MHEPAFELSHRLPGRRVSQAGRQALCLTLLLVLPGGAQNGPGLQPHGGLPQPIGPPIGGGLQDIGSGDPIEEEKRLRALNVERQKDLVSDTDKLLKLTNELNTEIARANPDSLTAGQVRKLAAIEKLAHSVKDKMITSVRGIPAYNQLPQGRMR